MWCTVAVGCGVHGFFCVAVELVGMEMLLRQGAKSGDLQPAIPGGC